MNILLTSAGRRTYMVEYFKQALNGQGQVFAVNSQQSPALLVSDQSFVAPLIYNEAYIPFLLELCREHRIDFIVSFFDIDMPVLAAHRAEFEAVGTRLAMSDAAFFEICSDKYRMNEELHRHGIECPKTTIDREEAVRLAGLAGENAEITGTANADMAKSYSKQQESECSENNNTCTDKLTAEKKFIIKPRFGMGSLGVYTVCGRTELEGAYSMCRREIENSYLRFESKSVCADDAVLIQECLTGNEYGLDIICDFDGNYVNTIVRHKYGMRSGETDEAIVLVEGDTGYAELKELGAKIADAFKPKGLIDVDVIMDEAELVPRVIDMNGRFGGGYPFSHIAGADVPKAYVLWAEGRKAEGDTCCFVSERVRGYKDITPRVFR